MSVAGRTGVYYVARQFMATLRIFDEGDDRWSFFHTMKEWLSCALRVSICQGRVSSYEWARPTATDLLFISSPFAAKRLLTGSW